MVRFWGWLALLEGVGIVRGFQLALVAGAGVLAAAAGTVLAIAVNVATGGSARWFPTMERYPLWWTAGATVTVAGAGLLMYKVQRWYDSRLRELIPAVQQPEPWVVDRPAEVNQIVAALRRPRGGTVGITTTVNGAGGFGKTTVAKIVRADRRVLRRFRGRLYWVTLGRDVHKQALVGLVNDLLTQLQPDRPGTFTSAQQAADHLAAVLNTGPRWLLILDDAWSDDQLALFPIAGRCTRLVTTRNPSLAIGASVPVRIDQMSQTQALAVLSAGLPPMPTAIAQGLLEETGRWPLLLRLVNKILTDESRLHTDITPVAEDLLAKIRQAGRLHLDQLTGTEARQLDVNDPDQRRQAVRATIEASTGLLPASDRGRLAELGVFAEDETVPVALVGTLWQVTGGLDQRATETLCARLADLALVRLIRTSESGAIELHDVIREYLRAELGPARRERAHQVLLDAAMAELPMAPAASMSGSVHEVTAWWEIPEHARYLRDHLIEHMIAAGRPGQAETVATDLRWAAARLEYSGPAGPSTDLALADTARAERLRRLVGQCAHLLAPINPPHSLFDIFCSRIGQDPEWGSQAQSVQARRGQPAVINLWPLPDLPDLALRNVLTGHTGTVEAMAIVREGTWLATGGRDGTARTWDLTTGQQLAVFTGHTGRVTAVAIAPDGTWLATVSDDRAGRIWDATTGQLRAVLSGHTDTVLAVAIAADGTCLATGSLDGTVRIWDPDGTQRGILVGHKSWVTAVATAPDGTWLATASIDGTARIWDIRVGQLRAVLDGHASWVGTVAIAPDGTWLATGSHDRTARIWDAATGQQLAVLEGHTSWVRALAIAPDGTWLATGSHDRTARIWDAATGQQRAVLAGHKGPVTAVAIAPDGTWLATASDDRTVQIWDATGQQRVVLVGHTDRVTSAVIGPDSTWLATTSDDRSARIWDASNAQQPTALARSVSSRFVRFAPDGSWLASTSDDGAIRIWDATTGQPRGVLTDQGKPLTSAAIAPDCTWIATTGQDDIVRIWDIDTRTPRAVRTGHREPVTTVAIAPDGNWLATGSADRSIRILDTSTGTLRTVLTGHTRDVTAVEISPDGTWLASASRDGTARIWDACTGQQRAVLSGHTGWVGAMAIAPDGTWLATSSDDLNVQIWDTSTAQQRATLTGHRDRVTAVAIACGGNWLSTISHDRTLRIWHPATGEIVAAMRVDGQLDDCAWNPCSQSLAAAGERGLYLFTFRS